MPTKCTVHAFVHICIKDCDNICVMFSHHIVLYCN